MDYAQLVELHGGVNAAARAAGLAPTTFKNRLAKQKTTPSVSETEELEYPNLPSSELPAEEIVEHACKEFARHLAAKDARRWFEIKVKSNKPIGVCFMGDPHIDNYGCNWPLLREHIRILKDTPGMYAIGGNDLTDNWIGRLLRLYADSSMSRKQTLKVVKWLMSDAGIRWLCYILGNHDQWGDMPYLVAANAAPIVPVEDWQARFQLVFPNGTRTRIHMAHNFKGHSQWNNLHGAQKQAMFGEDTDILACAHTHSWAMHQEENSHRGNVYWLIRSRGYKHIDQYADDLGYGNQRFGASITAVIDPAASGVKRIQCFADVRDAANYLEYLRGRA
jgi:hypothetical protein